MDVISYALHALDSDLHKIDASLRRLTTEKVWRRLRESANSVGNLCLHLAGAEYQRMVSAIGGQTLVRERTLEFSTEGGFTPDELSQRLHQVREESRRVFGRLTSDELDRKIPVYFQPDDWIRMLEHDPEFTNTPAYKPQKISLIILGLVSHYSYHTGQIVMLTKLLQDGDQHILRWKH